MQLPKASAGDVVVASHNLMHGTRLRALHDRYTTFLAAAGLHVLCLQENQGRDRVLSAPDIVARLGDRFSVCCDDSFPDLAMVYDHTRLGLVESHGWPVPSA